MSPELEIKVTEWTFARTRRQSLGQLYKDSRDQESKAEFQVLDLLNDRLDPATASNTIDQLRRVIDGREA